MGFIYGIMPPIPPLKPFEGVQPVKPHITLVKLKRRVHVEVKYRQFVVALGQVVLLPSPSRPRYIALRAEPQGELGRCALYSSPPRGTPWRRDMRSSGRTSRCMQLG